MLVICTRWPLLVCLLTVTFVQQATGPPTMLPPNSNLVTFNLGSTMGQPMNTVDVLQQQHATIQHNPLLSTLLWRCLRCLRLPCGRQCTWKSSHEYLWLSRIRNVFMNACIKHINTAYKRVYHKQRDRRPRCLVWLFSGCSEHPTFYIIM